MERGPAHHADRREKPTDRLDLDERARPGAAPRAGRLHARHVGDIARRPAGHARRAGLQVLRGNPARGRPGHGVAGARRQGQQRPRAQVRQRHHLLQPLQQSRRAGGQARRPRGRRVRPEQGQPSALFDHGAGRHLGRLHLAILDASRIGQLLQHAAPGGAPQGQPQALARLPRDPPGRARLRLPAQAADQAGGGQSRRPAHRDG